MLYLNFHSEITHIGFCNVFLEITYLNHFQLYIYYLITVKVEKHTYEAEKLLLVK